MSPTMALDTPPNIRELLTEQLQRTPHYQECARTYWPGATDLPSGTTVYPRWVSPRSELEPLLSHALMNPGKVLDAKNRGDTFEMVPVVDVKMMDSSLDRNGRVETKLCNPTWFVLVSRAHQTDLAAERMPEK